MPTENFYDVIIIGAGPAGLACAKVLKNSALRVLVLEKNKNFGNKVCAGGLTRLASTYQCLQNKTEVFSKMRMFYQNKAHLINYQTALQTIDRLRLAELMVEEIKPAGNITCLTETTVSKIKAGKTVVTDKGEFIGRYLVGADGGLSVLRIFLGLRANFFIGLNCWLNQERLEMQWHFNPQAWGSAYIWVFPHYKQVNVGIYFNPQKIKMAKAKNILLKFIKDKFNNQENIIFSAGIINNFFNGCVFNNIYLAGEAAGLTSKLTGEGIGYALVSGQEIGRKILDNRYKMPLLKKILLYKKRQDFAYSVYSAFPKLQPVMLKKYFWLSNQIWFQRYFGV